MKKITLFTLLLCFISSTMLSAQVTLPPSGNNQKSEVTQYIGALAHVTIAYSSPDVTGPNGQDRTGSIWGQLVPYGLTDLGFGIRTPSPWRAGANENTTIAFSHDMLVQGKAIKAGTYGLHIIVEETGPWTLIFSNNTTAWGSFFYKPEEDALRVEATPEDNELHEWLTYEFIDRQPESTTVAMMWEKKKLPFKIEVQNITDLYVDNLRKELQSSKGFNYLAWVGAASYCAQNDVNLEEALTWADAAISAPFIGQENFTTLQTKATILDKLGRAEESEAILTKAINHPTCSSFQVHNMGRQLIAQGQKDKALKIFKLNYERFEKAWPTEVGMARGLSAVGKYAEAAEHAKLAVEQAPDDLNRNFLKQAVEKLEKGEDIN